MKMKFENDQFQFDGMYLMYGPDRKFVARFKVRADRSGFVSFLKKNFTVEEYFEALTKGTAPVTIMEAKGYVSATVKKALKSMGYEPTMQGKKQYLSNQVKKDHAEWESKFVRA